MYLSLDSLTKRDSCTKGTQLCETGDSTSTLTICLAVIIPVVCVALGLGIIAYKVYKRNKQEALDDDDPDFNGENTVLPDVDYPSSKEMYLKSSDAFPNGQNPFESVSERYPQNVIDEAAKGEKFLPPASRLNNGSRLTMNSRQTRVESFVLPFAEETHSKHSLEYLSKQLGGDYEGYRIPERESRIHSAAASRKSSMSLTSKPLTAHEKNPKSTENSSKSVENETTLHIPAEPSFQVSENSTSNSPSKLRTQINSLESDDSNKTHTHDSTSMSPVTYSTPNESLVPSDKKRGSDDDSMNFKLEDPADWDNNHLDVPELDELTYNDSGDSVVITDKDNKKKNMVRVDPNKLPDFAADDDEADEPITQEEDEQFKRMKSVYKVYFSRENSVKSKSNKTELQFGEEELPPLPTYPQQAVTSSHDNLLSVPQQMNDDPRASVTSSIYVPVNNTSAPSANEGYYPHQQIQNMMMQQQQMQNYAPPRQQVVRRPRKPAELKKLQALPSPHQFKNRNSALENFNEYEKESKYQEKRQNRPQINQNFNPLENVQWGESSMAKPSPSQIRDSIVMFNPVEINFDKTYRPKGTLGEQVRQASASSGVTSIKSSLNSPQSPLYGFHSAFPERPHGAENLIPQSGSQADLRKQMGNANL